MIILFLGNKSPQQPQSFYPFSDGNIINIFIMLSHGGSGIPIFSAPIIGHLIKILIFSHEVGIFLFFCHVTYELVKNVKSFLVSLTFKKFHFVPFFEAYSSIMYAVIMQPFTYLIREIEIRI